MKKIFATTLPIVGVFGLIYLLAAFLIQYNGLLFSNYPNWASRFSLMGVITVAIVRFRLANGNLIGFKQGMLVGLISSLCLSAIIATHTFALREYMHPSYNQELRSAYHDILARETDPKWTEEQIDRQLTQYWGYYFTTQGGVIIEILGGISIGLVASLSVSYLARRAKDN